MCKYYETEGARIELLVKFSLYTEFFYIITSTELYVQILIWHAWETGVEWGMGENQKLELVGSSGSGVRGRQTARTASTEELRGGRVATGFCRFLIAACGHGRCGR